ncbi:MAG: DUF58 domain-containing protein [Actinomycetota bacterium]|nr:DUF58 domain-containing protein [Actinomycetota bacterium]
MREVSRRLLLHARRISVRPTARGWQALFFGALSFFLARLIGTTQLYQLAYALAGILLVALVLGLFLSRGLGYARRILASRFVAGHPSHVGLVVSNASRTRSPGVGVVDHLPRRRLLETPPVEGPGERTTQQPILFPRRGLYELGPAEIWTTDPFRLLRFVRKFETRPRVAVYPEVFELAGFPVGGRGREAGAQGAPARQGDEFSGLREYRQGDDRRHIHWKSVARTGELVVKEFSHNAPQHHAVVLDLHRAGHRVPEAEVEDAVSAAGSVLLHLAREGLPFRLLCTDRERSTTELGTGEAAYLRAMDLLAAVRADGDVEPGDFLGEKLHEEREGLGAGVILVSRSLNDGLVESVRKLRMTGLSVVVVVLAAHTYGRIQGARGVPSTRREAAFSEDIRRLELAGAVVRVVRHPGGVAAFAGVQWEAPGVRGAR